MRKYDKGWATCQKYIDKGTVSDGTKESTAGMITAVVLGMIFVFMFSVMFS